MRGLEQVMQQVFSDRDLTPEQVPALDLYMDQVLTLFNDGLSDNKRHPDDKLLTKTMINNYSKEQLTGRDDVDFEACWKQFLDDKQRLRDFIPAQLSENMAADLDDPAQRLSLCLALSAIASYMRRMCEAIIDETAADA